MIKIYWYISAYIRKHGLKFLAVILVAGIFFSFVLPYLFRNFSHRQTYYIGIVGEYDFANLPLEIKRQLSRGLVTYDETGTFDEKNLDLARKVTIENNGTRYRFTLKEGLIWQDGKEFVATDVNYRLREAQTTYEGDEVIYDLPAVLASFPQLLTEPLVRLENHHHWLWADRVEVIGIGSTRFTNYKWLDSSHRSLSEVTLDDLETRIRYVYRFYYTQDEALQAFKLGKIDYLFDITNADEVKDWATTTVNERKLTNQYLAVFFNNNNEIMTRNLRQALSYAVEKERPGYDRAIGPISEKSFAFFPGAKRYDKNIDSGVERLLDELPGAPIEIELVTTARFYDIASRIEEDWTELGDAAAQACQESEDIEDKSVCEYLHITTHIQIQTIPDTNNFQAMLVGQEIPYDPDQYNLWHSNLATNFTHYKNTRVDNLLEKGRQTLLTAERTTLYQEFQQNLLEDPPAIFLWYLQSSDLARGGDTALINLSRNNEENMMKENDLENPENADTPAENPENDEMMEG